MTKCLTVKKLYPYQGFMGCKIKDYEVLRVLDEKADLEINFGREKMTIKNKDIRERIVDKSIPIASKIYEGMEYSLWGFRWIPDKTLDDPETFSKTCL